jgi:phosphate transport system substrate-binding protein
MNLLPKAAALVGLAALLSSPAHAAAVEVDRTLEVYAPVSGVSGNLNSIGSDTLNNLMTMWAEKFKEFYPNVNIQIEGKGSSTAPPALIEGTAQLGPMSREMKPTEIDAFEKKYGYRPISFRVALDGLAVFVHKDNPVESLTMKQVDGIFSVTRKRGGSDISNWGQAGVSALSGQAVSIYGRNSASGTYGFFKEIALKNGDYKSSVKEQPGSSAVVQGIASDAAGVGYSGIGYLTSGVKVLPLAGDDGVAYGLNYENCLDGSYPLARFLHIYVNKKPGQSLDKLTYEFIRFILSQQGQEIVIKDGYYPLPNSLAG